MIDTKEQLKLAAKAAGYVRMKYIDYTPYVSLNLSGDDFVAWNPKGCNDDALKLAMKLFSEGKIRMQWCEDRIDIFEHWYGVWVPHTYDVTEDNLKSVFRTAITNVAAEIGKRL